jgi:hypothetical protein
VTGFALPAPRVGGDQRWFLLRLGSQSSADGVEHFPPGVLTFVGDKVSTIHDFLYAMEAVSIRELRDQSKPNLS